MLPLRENLKVHESIRKEKSDMLRLTRCKGRENLPLKLWRRKRNPC
jgi:hypothetical protein